MLHNYNFAYWLDQNNIITSIILPQQWDEFALANGGTQAVADKVLGRNLKSFVTGFMTMTWLESVLELARHKDTSIECTYRCDSPMEKRYLKMCVSPQGYGQLYVEYDLLQTQPISVPVRFVYVTAADSRGLERCSVCNRVRPNGIWYELDVAYQKGLINLSYALPVDYTVCQECMFQLHTLRYHFT